MPKKQNKSFVYKPSFSPSPSPTSQIRRDDHHRRPTASDDSESPSVNDLISHLRRTQVSSALDNGNSSASRSVISQASVHPSLRSLLELPNTPPPRPRAGSRRAIIGGRPVRLVPGPPPPDSWLARHSDTGCLSGGGAGGVGGSRTAGPPVIRLDRLPGARFPSESSLVHAVLRSMASNWAWHLDYDGPFLCQLPLHIRELMLSYVATYAGHARTQPLKRMGGLGPLFLPEHHLSQYAVDELGPATGSDADVRRLDMAWSLGYWTSFKQLSSELVISAKAASAAPKSAAPKKEIPTSWDEEDLDVSGNSDESFKFDAVPAIPKVLNQTARFSNLRYLSLAHPAPGAASWNSLLHLLSRIVTITHLSLAHWPAPTRTPQNAPLRMKPPNHRGPYMLHGGTDEYSAVENNWAEAAGILRQLSRYSYCLKWLDLEGCSDWIGALIWTGTMPDGQPCRPGSAGPEWNASWRNIEWISLGPGFEYPRDEMLSTQTPIYRSDASHGPASSDLPWDVEEERWAYRREKGRQAWQQAVLQAEEVCTEIRSVRKAARGKWLQAYTGGQTQSWEVSWPCRGP
ncbi:Uncharacterized protein PECH_004705 [Penicillium ucsense]|uniref:Tafazzin n=1 Tax=Penicillium ucsense TaxID=2839758 RepID=A0A8J8W5B8_9EURO|nr:Uncharacterized protein PECM_003460 [Penicillium ucsense]KAF7736899.1 Uncharacterized protein PECH_004705 [Penicillium ucsense]